MTGQEAERAREVVARPGVVVTRQRDLAEMEMRAAPAGVIVRWF